jgi:hypothetical protein
MLTAMQVAAVERSMTIAGRLRVDCGSIAGRLRVRGRGCVALTEPVGGHEDGQIQMQMTGAWTWYEV